MRIPRKIKKEYKKLWERREGRSFKIVKSSIGKRYSDENGKAVWYCTANTKPKK